MSQQGICMMASVSQGQIYPEDVPAGSRTTYTRPTLRRKAVGSGADTTSTPQDNQVRLSDTSDTGPLPGPAAGQPTNTTIVLAVSSTGNQPESLSSPTPSTPAPEKHAPEPVISPVQSYRRDKILLFMVILASVCFGVTSWFAQATFSNTSLDRARNFFQNEFRVDIGDTLTILTLLSRLLTLVTGFVLDRMLEVLQWSLICRDRGVAVSSVLAVSSTTGALGTLGIILRKGPEPVARIWAATKLALRFFILVSGVILFINTSIGTVYRSTYSYLAAAGIGPFEGSYVDAYRDSLRTRNLNMTDDVVPYSTLAVAHSLIINPMHSVNSDHAGCGDESCDSYTLPGGLANSSPLPPRNITGNPVILLQQVPSYRVDFRRDVEEDMTDEDCDLYWQHPYLIAIRFCVAPSRVQQGSVYVALQVCDKGTSGNVCLSSSLVPPGMNTTFSLYALNTSLVVSRSNYSILSVSRSSPVIADYSLDVPSYRTALRWLLNYTAAGIPAPSSAVEYFWASPDQLTSDYWSTGQRQAFQSLLAYPLWFFNVNNAGNLAYGANGTDLVLPDEFYTTASAASPFTKVAVNRATFVVFLVLQSIVLISAWSTVFALWMTDVRLPKISSYPIVCFASKVEDWPRLQDSRSPVSEIFGPGMAGHADSAEVRAAVAGRRVKFRDEIEPAQSLMPWPRDWKGCHRRKATTKGAVNLTAL